MTTKNRDRSAERVGAWATGVGVGLAVFMISWLIGSRIADLLWEAPVAPIVAMLFALSVGTGAALGSRRRLTSSLGPGNEHSSDW